MRKYRIEFHGCVMQHHPQGSRGAVRCLGRNVAVWGIDHILSRGWSVPKVRWAVQRKHGMAILGHNTS